MATRNGTMALDAILAGVRRVNRTRSGARLISARELLGELS